MRSLRRSVVLPSDRSKITITLVTAVPFLKRPIWCKRGFQPLPPLKPSSNPIQGTVCNNGSSDLLSIKLKKMSEMAACIARNTELALELLGSQHKVDE